MCIDKVIGTVKKAVDSENTHLTHLFCQKTTSYILHYTASFTCMLQQLIYFSNSHKDAVSANTFCTFPSIFYICDFKRNCQCESQSFTIFTVYLDCSVHAFNQCLYNRHFETDSVVYTPYISILSVLFSCIYHTWQSIFIQSFF